MRASNAERLLGPWLMPPTGLARSVHRDRQERSMKLLVKVVFKFLGANASPTLFWFVAAAVVLFFVLAAIGSACEEKPLLSGAGKEDPEPQAPRTQAPRTQAPRTQAPRTQAPRTQASEARAPRTQAPRTRAQRTPTPEFSSGRIYTATWLPTRTPKAIKFRCPSCSGVSKVSAKLADRKGLCSKCGLPLRVPSDRERAERGRRAA
jgi:hypothetical protein